MTIAWNDRLAVDHGLIDEDHKVLIDLSNKFISRKGSASKSELALILSDLEHYARTHFWRESELQRKIGFCYAEQQADEHMQLVSTLGNIAIRFFQAKEGSDLTTVKDELSSLFHGWLIDHILKSDIHMAAYKKEIAALTVSMPAMHIEKALPKPKTIGSEMIYKLSIDNGVIDDDHRHLVELINNFIIGTAENVDNVYLVKTLSALSEYTVNHFAREETLQKSVGFPFANAHHQAHQNLISTLGGFQNILNSRTDVANVRAELCAMLKSWLLDHVGEQDARMRPYVEEMRGPSKKLPAFQRAVVW